MYRSTLGMMECNSKFILRILENIKEIMDFLCKRKVKVNKNIYELLGGNDKGFFSSFTHKKRTETESVSQEKTTLMEREKGKKPIALDKVCVRPSGCNTPPK